MISHKAPVLRNGKTGQFIEGITFQDAKKVTEFSLLLMDPNTRGSFRMTYSKAREY